jgi:O-methyltransferase
MERKQFEQAELNVLIRELGAVLKASVPGDIVEMGCYKGETSLHIARLVRELAPGKKLYLYDSFDGLPAKQIQDESPAGQQFKAGELPSNKKEVVRRMRAAGMQDVKVTKAWFSELTPKDMPEKIAFAFLDGDFYQSITDSLRLVWPGLASGALVIVDDYRNEALPGVARAVDSWLSSHPVKKLSTEKSLAVIKVY